MQTDIEQHQELDASIKRQAMDAAICAINRGSRGPVLVYYSPANSRIRYAGANTQAAARLGLLVDAGRLLFVGVYGYPWGCNTDNRPLSVRVQGWILEDLEAAITAIKGEDNGA
jgi:hypothetical protein